MNHPAHVALVRRLIEEPAPRDRATGEVPVADYTTRERFLREQTGLFARLPAIVAHESELAAPGSCLAVEVAGVPLIVTRGEDGRLKAFLNACRHRSTQLVPEGPPCRKKAIVCPYHGWTYDLGGRLVHVPHQESFHGAEASRQSLVAAHARAAAGFVWASLAPFEPSDILGPLEAEMTAAGAGCVYRRSSREVFGNWKLVIDAFLDGYHIRHLHRDSIYRFFIDARYEAEKVGDHIRAVTARRALTNAKVAELDTGDIRQLVTPSYLLFPNTIVIRHPDYTSIVTSTPLAEDRTRFVHWMVIPAPLRTEAEEAHYAKSFTLIDEAVFLREDLAAVEAMQRGMRSGANATHLVGEYEHAVLWFHEAIARALMPRSSSSTAVAARGG